jgi:4-diphosphocytidyl-2-C-methyl-D-erythritol kinase
MIRLQAPAKINLFLEITGKRPDGYHTLETLFQTISFGDELQFRLAPTLRLTCSEPTLPTDERNLVLRAARCLQALFKERRGAHIHLTKRVPMGAGLGGGSSDAAAAILGLQRLWRRRAPATKLRDCAVRLGADVPFFLEKGLCAATGIGEKLRRLPSLPARWLLLVYPGFGVSTPEAYGRVRLPWTRPQGMRRITAAIRRRDFAQIPTLLFNRFEDLVFPHYPELPALKRELLAGGAQAALMSGSGSSVFGFVSSRAAGERLLASLRRRYPQSWLVKTLP